MKLDSFRSTRIPAAAVTVCVLLFATALPGQDRRIAPIGGSARRLALVMGNDAYPDKRLYNAVNDARVMQAALEAAGFSVKVQINSTLQQMEEAIDRFVGEVHAGDATVFYYSGHGIQIQDQNYLVPVDFAAATAVDAKYKSYPAQRLLENLEAVGAALQILIVDACRDNPYRRLRGAGGGLAPMQAGRGVYIAFATAPGKTASDNPGGRNGLFTGELAAVIREPGLTLDQVFNRTRARVSEKSGSQQVPWSTSSVVGDFYFRGNGGEVLARESGSEREDRFWDSIKDSSDPLLFEDYLKRFPEGLYRTIAERKLVAMRGAAHIAPPAAVERRGPQPGDVKVNSRDGLRYAWTQPGKFRMGCLPGDSDCLDQEKPAHEVAIGKGFWLGQTEVTQEAYQRVIGKNPSYFKGEKRPVESVTWMEASEYCGKVGGRLPTEAEWEYAARAGSIAQRYEDVDAVGWFGKNSQRMTHEVGGKQANAWGLYDMLGNVWEWTADWYDERYYQKSEKVDPQGPQAGRYRALRGGSWGDSPRYVRVSGRDGFELSSRDSGVGFRCAGELP